MITDVTQDIILSKRWENEEIKPYTMVSTANSQKAYPLLSPITLVTEQLRRNIIKYGFQELNTDYILERFWNTDVLLFPQSKSINSDKSIINVGRKSGRTNPIILENVARLHNKIFGYEYKKNISEDLILRSHLTGAFIKEVAQLKPGRYFTSGRIFRDKRYRSENFQFEICISQPKIDIKAVFTFVEDFLTESFDFDKNITFYPANFDFASPSFGILGAINSNKIRLGAVGVIKTDISRLLNLNENTYFIGLGVMKFANCLASLPVYQKRFGLINQY